MRLFDEMRQQGLQTIGIICGAVISARGKYRIPKRVWQLFDEMRQQQIKTVVITYTALIGTKVLTVQPS